MTCVICGRPYTLPHFCGDPAVTSILYPTPGLELPNRFDVLEGNLRAAGRQWTGPHGLLLLQAADAIRELRGKP